MKMPFGAWSPFFFFPTTVSHYPSSPLPIASSNLLYLSFSLSPFARLFCASPGCVYLPSSTSCSILIFLYPPNFQRQLFSFEPLSVSLQPPLYSHPVLYSFIVSRRWMSGRRVLVWWYLSHFLHLEFPVVFSPRSHFHVSTLPQLCNPRNVIFLFLSLSCTLPSLADQVFVSLRLLLWSYDLLAHYGFDTCICVHGLRKLITGDKITDSVLNADSFSLTLCQVT